MAVPRPILCFVLAFLVLDSRTENNNCVKPCTCLGHFIDCSNATSSFIPSGLPSWVKNLDLSSNEMNGKSMDGLGHLVDLIELKFSKNFLSNVPVLPDTLDSLSTLILSHNEIVLSDTSALALQRVPWLLTLDLSNNHIRDLPAGLFMNNSVLQVLNLNSNWLRKVESGRLENLTQLQDLRISRNKLKHISKDAFRQLRNLRSLDLNRNQIVKLESLMFQDLVQLKTMRLRRNNITFLEDGVFWGLKNITTLQLDHNNVHNISKSWLYGLDSLLHLNLSHNHIGHMDPECWSFNPSLQELDLSHNRLETIGRNTFHHLLNLQKLSLSNNQISVIEEGVFNHTPSLLELDLSGNKLSWASEEMNGIFSGLRNLILLSLAANRISSINHHAFDGMDNLRVLNLANNSLLSVQENPWAHMNHLQKLTLNATSLMCDCSLAWLPVWLLQQPFVSDVHALCAYPLALHDVSVMDVPAQNFSCDGIPNPHIIEDPKTQMVLKGTNVTLHCRANSSSDEPMIFRWKRDNVELNDLEGIKIKYHFLINSDTKEQNSDLHISSVSLKDDGIYQCFVSNSFGSVHSSKANVTVVVFPKFTKIPENLQVKTGSIARLPCAAEGLPEPKVSWQKDGNDFPAARERRMHVIPDDDVFFIVNVQPFDMGVYSCMARNDAGVNVTNASLTILETPSFVKLMENKDVRAGQAVVLECMSSGFPKPYLKWLKDGTPIRPSERYHFTANDELLIIRNAQLEDAGRYECEITNPLGTEKGFSELTIVPASGALISGDDLAGIIIITVVCCAVITSIVWVVIIYQTRKLMARPDQSSAGAPPMSIETTSDHRPGPLLLYGHPGGQLVGQVDTDSEHSSCKDSGTGDSDKRSQSHEDLLPSALPHAGNFLQSTVPQTGEEYDDDGSDTDIGLPAAQRLVGPARSPVKPPPVLASVKHPQRQRRTNHDRCYRMSLSAHPQTATVHTPRPSSYHCVPLQGV